MTKTTQGTKGPDWEDITNLLSMLRRDMGVSVVWTLRARRCGDKYVGYAVETVIRPAGTPESIWDTYVPMVVEREWNPRLDRELAAVVWTELFLCYSYDFPSDWPTSPIVTQLPLP